jgi:DNA-binding MarR family transcriptional regulator
MPSGKDATWLIVDNNLTNPQLDNSRYNEYTNLVTATKNKPSGIQQEIKQNKPFRSLEEEVLIALLRTADQVTRRGAEVMKPFDISPTQYNALRILRGGGEKGLPCREIGERMINHDPDITRLLDRLVKRGLVERRREEKDRRVITTRITAAGLELLKKMDRPVSDYPRELLGELGEQRLQSLLKALAAIREKTA